MKDKEFLAGSLLFSVLFLVYWISGHPYFITERIVMFVAIVGFGGIAKKIATAINKTGIICNNNSVVS